MKTFRKTYIEITNVCDLSCDFCRPTTRAPRFMDREVFSIVLEKIRGYSKLLHFHVMGEPLLHPEIGPFLVLCGDHGYQVNLVTNGMSLKEKGDSILGKPALKQVSISVHSISGNPDIQSLDAYFQSIYDFAQKASRVPGLSISLRLWNMNGDANHQRSAEILHHLERTFLLPGSLLDTLCRKPSCKLGKNVWLNCAPRFEWPDLSNRDYGNTGFCLGLRNQFAILVDGTVVPCCLDRNGVMALGNIREQALSDILDGTRARKIRRGFDAGLVAEELCRKCGYRLKFGEEGSAKSGSPILP
jgi:radical SAM protein with 4Fe4S-binding SPASM domain